MTETALVTPAHVAPLRARLRVMPPQARDAALAVWAAGGYPSLADTDGSDALVPLADYLAIEKIVNDHEPEPDVAFRQRVGSRFDSLPDGIRLIVLRRYAMQSLDAPCSFGDNDGRFVVLSDIIDEVEAEAAALAGESVNAVLAPLPEIGGEIITTPVADEAALEAAVEWSKLKVDEVKTTVGANPALAAAALAAERLRKSPRKGVIEALAPLVVGQGSSPAPCAPDEADAGEAAGRTPPPAEATEDSAACPPATSPSDGSAPSEEPSGEVPGPPSPVEVDPSPVPPPTTDAGEEDENRTAATPSSSPVGSLAKYGPILGRLSAELAAVVKLIDADLHRVDV